MDIDKSSRKNVLGEQIQEINNVHIHNAMFVAASLLHRDFLCSDTHVKMIENKDKLSYTRIGKPLKLYSTDIILISL